MKRCLAGYTVTVHAGLVASHQGTPTPPASSQGRDAGTSTSITVKQ